MNKLQNIFIIINKLLYEKQSYSVPCLVSHGDSAYADDTSNLTCIFFFSLKCFIVILSIFTFCLATTITSGGWRAHDSDVTRSSFLLGETYNSASVTTLPVVSPTSHSIWHFHSTPKHFSAEMLVLLSVT